MSYVELKHSRAALLARGRKQNAEEGKHWIPSLAEWQVCLNKVHYVAKKGCPFAIETIRDSEQKLEMLQDRVDKNRALLQEKMQASVIEVVENRTPRKTQEKIEVDEFIPFTINALECITKLDRMRSEYMNASRLGLVNFRFWEREFAKICEQFRALKHDAFRYKDDGVRSFEYQGTMEWEMSVKRLKKEPSKQEYNPRFYMLGREVVNSERRAVPPGS